MYIAIANAIYSSLLQGSRGGFPQASFGLDYNAITSDFTFTRNSFATRVNEFGLIETVTDLGSNLIQNGSFDELGSELVTNGDFENGSTDWSFIGTANISGGVANFPDTTVSFLIQPNIIPLTVKTYKIQYEVVTTNGNNFRFAGGNSGFGSVTLDSATVGVKTVYLTSNGTKGSLQFNNNAFIGSIDNVSVKQVDPNDDWTIEALWTIQDGVASGNGATGGTEELNQNISSSGILIGSTVRGSFEIKNYVSGSVQVIGISNTISRSGNGIYEFQGELTSFNIRFRGSAFNGDVTNLSIQEVLEDDVPRIDYTGSTFVNNLGSEQVINGDFTDGTNNWNAAGGASISVSNNQLTIEADNDFNFYARQSVLGFEVGKQYKIEIDVAGGTTSKMQVSLYGEGLFFENQPIVLGKLSAIVTVTNGVDGSRFLDIYNRNDDGLNDTLIINSISVKEVIGKITTDKGAFLLEPISTNLIAYSEDIEGSNWTTSGIATTTDVTTSPNGTQNADLIDSVSNGSCFINDSTLTFTIGNTYTFSVFAKKGNNDWIRTAHVSSATNASWFDLENGVVGTVNGVSGTIEDFGNGWYKCTNTFVATQATGGNQIFIGICDANGSTDAGASGQNDYVWGMQVEELPYATSYIPTSGTTVTRAQESCVKNNVNGLFDDNVGSIYLAYDGVLTSGTTLNNMNPFRLYGQVSNRIRLYYTPDADFLGSSVDFENGGKIAWSCNGTTILTYINGALVDTHTITSNFTTLTNFILSTPFMTHRINDIKIYDKALTDEELTELTTI